MDVIKSLSAVAFLFALSACGNKSVDTVFPEGESSQGSAACMGQAVQNKFIVQWEDGRFSVEESTNAETFKEQFLEPQLQSIKFVEFDRVIQTKRSEPEVNALAATDWGQTMVKASSAWNEGYYGQGVLVAVVDAFVDVNHPQLKPRIAVNVGEIPNNGIDDDQNGIVDDYYGASFVSSQEQDQNLSAHGSHVAGIIAADPGFGSVKGVAPKSQIIPAQFIANDGAGSLGDAIVAMQYAANRGARIINASWGGAPCVDSLRNAFAALSAKGILLIVAAGNDGKDNDLYPVFPASFTFPTQITVAASSTADFMLSFSSNGFNSVNIAAPGERIWSTVPGNGIGLMDGTSMATPFVSGAAALLWSAKPNATAAQIKAALLQSVDVTPGHEFKVSTRGRLNIEKALEKLKQMLP